MIVNPLTANVPSYRKQSVDLLCKSTDWFLYDGTLVDKGLNGPGTGVYKSRRFSSS